MFIPTITTVAGRAPSSDETTVELLIDTEVIAGDEVMPSVLSEDCHDTVDGSFGSELVEVECRSAVDVARGMSDGLTDEDELEAETLSTMLDVALACTACKYIERTCGKSRMGIWVTNCRNGLEK